MPSNSKAKKSSGAAKAVTPKRRVKQLTHKSQPLPTFSPTQGEDASEANRIDNHPVDTEPNLSAMMDMQVDISSHLSVTEHFVDEVRADKAAEPGLREWGQSQAQTTPGTSRGRTQRGQALDDSNQAAPVAIAKVSDAVKAKVAIQMRSTPVMNLVTFDELDSKEEALPAPRKRGLKSGKLSTADTSVLCKIVWPHEVIYMAASKPAKYE